MAGRAALLACILLAHPVIASAHPAASERIEILTRRIEAQPRDQRLYIARGGAYSHDGKYELALTDLRKAEQLGDPVVVGYELGLLHHRMGKLEAARTHLDQFLERFPGHPFALEQRARLLAELGETQAAVADYERVFAATSRPNPGSYISAAKLLAAEAEGGVELALAMLDRGMKRLGVIPQLQQYAIELELRGGRSERALDRLEGLEPFLGEGPEWKVQMAELLMRMERSAEARRYLAGASSQLGELRVTPARRELARRITAIQAGLDAP